MLSPFAALPRATSFGVLLCALTVACGGEDDASPDTGADVDTADAAADVAVDVARDIPLQPDVEEDVPSGDCGDGEVTYDELCDDGNDVDDDACTNQCVPYGEGLCVACASDADCGGSEDRCLDIAGVMMCGMACEETCRRGWRCEIQSRDNEIIGYQCIPQSGDCAICDDTDEDGVCDFDDVCEGHDDSQDRDEDGTPDGCDVCPDDQYDDTDSDGVCDSDDICTTGNDTLDADEDGVPDACDPCPNSNPDDTDEDGVCDNVDLCLGFDDNGEDLDMDGVPDACDDAIEICDNDEDDDGDEILDCDDTDCLYHPACAACATAPEVGVGSWTATPRGPDVFRAADVACGGDGAPEIAVQFNPPAAGTYCALSNGTTFRASLYARTSCEFPSSELGCDLAPVDGTAEVEFDTDGTAPVFVLVDGAEAGETGEATVNIQAGGCDEAAVRLACEDAIVADVGTNSATLPLSGRSVGQDACATATGGEVVFAYTPDDDGTVCVQTANSGPLTVALYAQSECGTIASQLGCHTNQGAFEDNAQVQLDVSAGVPVYLFVDEIVGPTPRGGAIDLRISEGRCR